MSDSNENPVRRRRVILIAIAVLIGALILLFASERASIIETEPVTTTPARE